jgi:hypothetical protein
MAAAQAVIGGEPVDDLGGLGALGQPVRIGEALCGGQRLEVGGGLAGLFADRVEIGLEGQVTPLQRHMPGAGGAFDGGGGEGVEVKLGAHLGQKAQFGLAETAVGGSDVAGERIGGFIELGGQGVADHDEQRVEAVVLIHQGVDGLGDLAHAITLVPAEDRHVIHLPFDGDQFGGADRDIRGRHGDHHGDKRVLGGEGGKGVGQRNTS